MLAYVARQPVLDLNEETVGYELLFRNGHQNSFPDIDPDEATSRIITHNQLTVGIEEICQNKTAYINFHEDSLLRLFPTSLDKNNTVIEILEDVPISKNLVSACESLYKEGYKLALDDHNFEEQWRELYPFISILKVDISQFETLDLELFAEYIQSEFPHITLLAERVETEQEFKAMKEYGYSLFQGYYFAKPEMMEQPKLSSNKLKMINLMSLMSRMDVSYDELSFEIETDATLSFKLLRFISTSAMSTTNKITTVKHALTYLGLYEIRKFVALIAIANLDEDYCEELYNMAVIRAKFCEFLMPENYPQEDIARAYLTGLLSMIPAFLKVSDEAIIPKLPIDESMKDALLSHEGLLGILLNICKAYELGDWSDVEKCAELANINYEQVSEAYLKAIQWQSLNASNTSAAA